MNVPACLLKVYNFAQVDQIKVCAYLFIYIYVYRPFDHDGFCQARTTWLRSIGGIYSASVTLAKQKQHLMAKFADGDICHAEEAILASVDMSAVLFGQSSVSVNGKKYVANFDAGEEVISKRFDTVLAVHDWLLSMNRSYKSGSLHQSMRQVEQSVAAGVALEKAAGQLSETQQNPLPELVAGLSNVDVTAEFFHKKKSMETDLPMSVQCIHRGSLNTVTTLASSQRGLCAVLLGKTAWNKKFHCAQVVLSPSHSLEESVAHEKITSRCELQGLKSCGGIVVWSKDDWSDESKRVAALKLFQSEHPFLVNLDFSTRLTGERECVELQEDGTITRVALSWTTQPRETTQRLLYNTCFLEDLATSHIAAATAKIAEAIVRHVRSKVSAQQARTGQNETRKLFRKVNVIADGRCGWHAILAAADVQRYERTPRDPTSAYPLNPRIVQEEVLQAEHFQLEACGKALDQLDPCFHSRIESVIENPSFTPHDLEWIAQALDVQIRCTCCKEAWFACIQEH